MTNNLEKGNITISCKVIPAKANEYFYVKYQGKTLKMAEFYKEVKGAVDVKISECTFIYKDNEYNYKEYEDKVFQESNDLTYPNVFFTKIYPYITQFDNKNYIEGAKIFSFMDEAIATARMFLNDASIIFPYNINISWEHLIYPAYVFIRTKYLNSAILWYNSAFDLLMQIAYISFNFYSLHEDYKDEDSLEKRLVRCNYKFLSELYSKIKSTDGMKELWKIITRAINNNKIVNKYANIIKHKLGLSYEDLVEEWPKKFEEIVNQYGKKLPYIYGEKIDLDDTIRELRRCHNEWIDIINDFYLFLEYEKAKTIKDFSKIKVNKTSTIFNFKDEIKKMLNINSLKTNYLECTLKESYCNKKSFEEFGIYAIYFENKLMKIGQAKDGLRKRCSDYYRGQIGGTACLKHIDDSNKDSESLKICMYHPKNKDDCWWMEKYLQGKAGLMGEDMPWETKR